MPEGPTGCKAAGVFRKAACACTPGPDAASWRPVREFAGLTLGSLHSCSRQVQEVGRAVVAQPAWYLGGTITVARGLKRFPAGGAWLACCCLCWSGCFFCCCCCCHSFVFLASSRARD